jgi:hypothetical protein
LDWRIRQKFIANTEADHAENAQPRGENLRKTYFDRAYIKEL